MAYAPVGAASNIAKRKRCNSPRRTPIQEPLPETRPIPTLSDDENLVLSLRLRDGRPNRVPHHRSTGDCKYANVYVIAGECDWCKVLDAREASEAPAEPNLNVIVMPLRFQHSDVVASRVRRTA